MLRLAANCSSRLNKSLLQRKVIMRGVEDMFVFYCFFNEVQVLLDAMRPISYLLGVIVMGVFFHRSVIICLILFEFHDNLA